jgi:ABC-type oligopeptide transport system substrate-binding subunit
MRGRTCAAAALAVAIGLLGGCARSPDAEHAHANGGSEAAGTLLLGNGTGPDSLDPQKARVNEAHAVLRDLYECLTSLDKHAAPAPGVATSWDTSADGRTYTFHLRRAGQTAIRWWPRISSRRCGASSIRQPPRSTPR